MSEQIEYRLVFRRLHNGREFQWKIYSTREAAERNIQTIMKHSTVAFARIEQRTVTYSDWQPVIPPPAREET